MKIKSGFTLYDVCGEKVIIAEGAQNLNFQSMINLNETAAFLWEEAAKADFTPETLAQKLTENYDVSLDNALRDVNAMLEEWSKLGLIEA